MLISFNYLCQKYGKPKGIIHIGAHLMEEREDYIMNGVTDTIWIEANESIYNVIKDKDLVFNYAISNVDDEIINFNITNNGQSSSILELDKHRIHHPSVHVSATAKVKSQRMDTLVLKNNIDIDRYDFLNIDIQGAELLALKGFGELLHKINYIYTEVNTASLYKGCALLSEMDEYLDSYGFKRVETSMTEFEWGDALYIKF